MALKRISPRYRNWSIWGRPSYTHTHSSRRFGYAPDDDHHDNYHHKFVCFNCRKVWRPQARGWMAQMAACPECGGSVTDVGQMFRAPRKQDKREWRRIERMFA